MSHFEKIIIGTLAALALAACTPVPTYVVCTVDDDISFTTTNVQGMIPRDGMLVIRRKSPDNDLIHNMAPGETCERAFSIQWENEG